MIECEATQCSNTVSPLTTTPCKEGIVAEKQCSCCGETKPKSEFYTGRQCKICRKEYFKRHGKLTNYKNYKNYERTKNGHLVRTYRNMLSRTNGIQWQKAHLYRGKSLLPKADFYAWAKADPAYLALHAAWEKSEYHRRLTPSIDRLDSKLGYELSNMRWITHSENSALGNRSRFGFDASPFAN